MLKEQGQIDAQDRAGSVLCQVMIQRNACDQTAPQRRNLGQRVGQRPADSHMRPPRPSCQLVCGALQVVAVGVNQQDTWIERARSQGAFDVVEKRLNVHVLCFCSCARCRLTPTVGDVSAVVSFRQFFHTVSVECNLSKEAANSLYGGVKNGHCSTCRGGAMTPRPVST